MKKGKRRGERKVRVRHNGEGIEDMEWERVDWIENPVKLQLRMRFTIR